MLMALGLPSCSSDQDAPAPKPEVDAEIILHITVSDTSGGSRAPSEPEGGYDRGEGYENYIDIGALNFRFYFFDTANRFIAPFEVDAVLPLESESSSKTYMIHSVGMRKKFEEPIKVVALANWPEYPADADLVPGATTIDDIVTAQFAFDASKMQLSAENPVPLYGVSNPMTLDYDETNTARIGTLHLLRAYAKVEVNLSPECVFPIEWVKFSRHNSRGYCAPSGVYSQSDYVYNNYDKDYTKTPSVPAGAETDAELPFIKVSDTRWLAYVPEYRNVGRDDSERSTILVKFYGSEQEEAEVLYFATYDLTTSPNRPDKHFDILRNVWYKFTVSKKSAPLVQVIPYNEVDLGPLFGLLVGMNFKPIYDEDGSVRYWYDPNTGKYYGPDKVTEIDDPYVSVLLPERWTIIRDLNDRVIGYYDPKTGQYYNTDKKPVSHLDIDAATGWTILYGEGDKVIGYYDPVSGKYYDVDKKTEIENPTGGK